MTKEEVKAARAKLGLSLADFGAALGVNRTTVNRWELGRSKVHPSAAIAIRRLLDEMKPPRPARKAAQASAA